MRAQRFAGVPKEKFRRAIEETDVSSVNAKRQHISRSHAAAFTQGKTRQERVQLAGIVAEFGVATSTQDLDLAPRAIHALQIVRKKPLKSKKQKHKNAVVIGEITDFYRAFKAHGRLPNSTIDVVESILAVRSGRHRGMQVRIIDTMLRSLLKRASVDDRSRIESALVRSGVEINPGPTPRFRRVVLLKNLRSHPVVFQHQELLYYDLSKGQLDYLQTIASPGPFDDETVKRVLAMGLSPDTMVVQHAVASSSSSTGWAPVAIAETVATAATAATVVEPPFCGKDAEEGSRIPVHESPSLDRPPTRMEALPREGAAAPRLPPIAGMDILGGRFSFLSRTITTTRILNPLEDQRPLVVRGLRRLDNPIVVTTVRHELRPCIWIVPSVLAFFNAWFLMRIILTVLFPLVRSYFALKMNPYVMVICFALRYFAHVSPLVRLILANASYFVFWPSYVLSWPVIWHLLTTFARYIRPSSRQICLAWLDCLILKLRHIDPRIACAQAPTLLASLFQIDMGYANNLPVFIDTVDEFKDMMLDGRLNFPRGYLANPL